MDIALIPEYLISFKCSGTRCIDNCCHDWNIVVDQTTYFNCMEVTDVLLKSMFVKFCKANPSSTSDMDYAFIQRDLTGNCYFQTTDGLCLIHQHLGSKYLPSICHTYPRVIDYVNGRYEISGDLSCVEITKLLLLNPNKLKFVPIELSKIIDRDTIFYQICEPISFFGKWQFYILQLRDFFIQVLQDRSYQLVDRLIFLGIFTQKIQDSIRDSNTRHIPVLIDKYLEIFCQGAVKNLSRNFESNSRLQYEVLQELCRLNPAISLYVKCFREISTLILNPDQNEEDLRNYKEAYDNYYLKYIQDKEYFFENYLVGYVFQNILPYSEGENVFESYVDLIIHYALIRFHLIISSGINREINDTSVIQIVQKISKSFDHNKRFLNQLYQKLRSNACLSLAHMVILFLDP